MMDLTCVALPNSRYQTKTLASCVDVASIKCNGIGFLVLQKIEHSDEYWVCESHRLQNQTKTCYYDIANLSNNIVHL